MRAAVNLPVGVIVAGDAEWTKVSLRDGQFGQAPAGDADLQDGSSLHLNIVVEREFVRMRAQTDGIRFTLALIADKRFE